MTAGRNPAEVESISRRSFLGVLLGFGAVVVGAALSVPLIRFALHPLLTKTTEIGWSDIGKIEEFASLTAPLKKADYGRPTGRLEENCLGKSNLHSADERWTRARVVADLPAPGLFDSVD